MSINEVLVFISLYYKFISDMTDHRKIIAYWLLATGFMVAAMAVIGAITRLTESGLSIVHWHPVKDMLPPLSHSEWERLFAIYRETPEYQKINYGMSLADFKQIYFWEWLHRLWGRLIGIVYALPLLFFWIKRWIPVRFHGKLLIGLLLGGAQGFMGWFMVESGLVDRPDVSHYRLAAHLFLAFIILGYLLWLALDLLKIPGRTPYSFCKFRHGCTALFLLALTIIWGAFTAGLEAGLVYNTWPLMGGQFMPPESFGSITESHAWVQFAHRWLAALALFFVFSFAWRVKSIWLGIAVMGQFTLGIFTLLSALYIPLAALHQLGALITFSLLIMNLHQLWQARAYR